MPKNLESILFGKVIHTRIYDKEMDVNPIKYSKFEDLDI